MLVSGSSDIFRMINPDKLSHGRLYKKIYEMFAVAVEHECKGTVHVVGDDILGITANSTQQYTKYLQFRAIIDRSCLQEKSYTHLLGAFSDTKKQANTKANFFERV